jgi:hypothetical protein
MCINIVLIDKWCLDHEELVSALGIKDICLYMRLIVFSGTIDLTSVSFNSSPNLTESVPEADCYCNMDTE